MALEIRVSNLLPLVSFATRAMAASASDLTDLQAEVDALQAVTITGGGLATGGGTLAADRVITVTKATGAEAATGTDDTHAVTPLALAQPLGLKADKTVTITGGDLVTGGGSLAANRVLTVPKATGAEVAAGVNDTKAITPLALKTPLDVINNRISDVLKANSDDTISFVAWVAAHPTITVAGLYDPSALETLFQDTAGTIPVTAAGQPVKLIRNKVSPGTWDLNYSSATNATYEIDDEGCPYIDAVSGSVLASQLFTLTDPAYWMFVSERSYDLSSRYVGGMAKNSANGMHLFQVNQSVWGRHSQLSRSGSTPAGALIITTTHDQDQRGGLHIFDMKLTPDLFSSWVDGRPRPDTLNIDDELIGYSGFAVGQDSYLWFATATTGIQRERIADWPAGTSLTNCRMMVNAQGNDAGVPPASLAYQRFYGMFGCVGAAPSDDERERMMDYWRHRTKMRVLDQSDYDLFVFMGDSNMTGTTEGGTDASTEALTEIPNRTDGAIFQTHGMLAPIYPTTQHTDPADGSNGGSMLGPFAKAYYAKTGKRCLCIGAGRSTRGLLKPTTASYPDVATPGGSLIARAVRKTQRAIDHVEKVLGRKVEFRGVISGFGAYDANASPAPTAVSYTATINEFVTRLRSEFGIPDLKYFMISVDSWTGQEALYATIRNGQIGAVNPANGIYMAMPYQDFLDLGGSSWPDDMMGGGPHWNARAMNVAGQVAGDYIGEMFNDPEA